MLSDGSSVDVVAETIEQRGSAGVDLGVDAVRDAVRAVLLSRSNQQPRRSAR